MRPPLTIGAHRTRRSRFAMRSAASAADLIEQEVALLVETAS